MNHSYQSSPLNIAGFGTFLNQFHWYTGPSNLMWNLMLVPTIVAACLAGYLPWTWPSQLSTWPWPCWWDRLSLLGGSGGVTRWVRIPLLLCRPWSWCLAPTWPSDKPREILTVPWHSWYWIEPGTRVVSPFVLTFWPASHNNVWRHQSLTKRQCTDQIWDISMLANTISDCLTKRITSWHRIFNLLVS